MPRTRLTDLTCDPDMIADVVVQKTSKETGTTPL